MAETKPAGKRIALAIGNGAYAHAPSLNNARADAGAIAEKLKSVGFAEVTLLSDLDYEAMRRALQQFGRASNDAEMAVVYYAGHAIELDGENHLIPVDAKLEQDRDVMFEAVPLQQMLRAIDGPGALRLAILDACRDSPFATSMRRANQTRAIGRGLADIEPQGNTLVAFSARGGTVALDGEGPHSPFAQALIDLMPTPGLEVGFLFRQVRDTVLRATGRRQEPYLYGSLGADPIYLVPAVAAAAPAPEAPSAPDVFISYSSADREQAEELARALEAEGYRVWWDTKLLGGQQYRKAIVSQLDAAHAAVVIWTESSVDSDWVYDEATRARNAGKLIPVRAASLDPKAIQPPFGALHTILLGDRTGLRGALKRQGITPSQAGAVSSASDVRAEPSGPVDERTLEHGYWTAIQASSDPCDFETFLEKFPYGIYAAVARKRVEALIASASDRGMLENFLSQHPNSSHAGLAAARRVALEWAGLEKAGDPQRLRDFISRQGRGAEVEKAKATLATVEWRRLAASNDAGDIEQTVGDLRGFPEEALANARLAALRADSAAWSVALGGNDVASFERYLKQFPQGAHVADAKDKLNTLDPSPPIFNRGTVNIPNIKVPHIAVPQLSVDWTPVLIVLAGAVAFSVVAAVGDALELYALPINGTYVLSVSSVVYVGCIVVVAWRLSTAGPLRLLALFAALYVFETTLAYIPISGFAARFLRDAAVMTIEWTIVAAFCFTLKDKPMLLIAAAVGAAQAIYATGLRQILEGAVYFNSVRPIDYAVTFLCIVYGALRLRPELKGTNWILHRVPKPGAGG